LRVDLPLPRAVIVRLRGGLGNQMFQYALGVAVAEAHQRNLYLDDLALRADPPGATPRTYALGAFSITPRLASQVPSGELDRLPLTAQVAEGSPCFHPEVLALNPFPYVYLRGFWQSQDYFRAVEPLLREHFRFRRPPRRSAVADAIAESRASVGVHIRRQDYLTPAGKHLGFVGVEYYTRALEAMRGRAHEARFFVFSDDIEWCRDNIGLDAPHVFVTASDAGEDAAAADLQLMTMCRHFVIANSSFSWWAAWLSLHPGKIVIAPERWFDDPRLDARDVVPAGWLRL
jgi:hypothetical protein